MGLFDRDYMRFPQGPDDAYFEWLNEVGLSSRTYDRHAPRDGGAATSGVGLILVWIVASAVVGLALGVAMFALVR